MRSYQVTLHSLLFLFIYRENYLFNCACAKCESQAGDPEVTSSEEEEEEEEEALDRNWTLPKTNEHRMTIMPRKVAGDARRDFKIIPKDTTRIIYCRLRAVPPFPSWDRVPSAKARDRAGPLTRSPLVPFSARPTLPRSVHDHRHLRSQGLEEEGLFWLWWQWRNRPFKRYGSIIWTAAMEIAYGRLSSLKCIFYVLCAVCHTLLKELMQTPLCTKTITMIS